MLTIEKYRFDKFLSDYKKGKFAHQRLGQAFYNQFGLHKLANQDLLNNIYSKDGQHAINCINNFVIFN